MDTNAPLVSVIVPTHNRAELIIHTLDSLANQTYKNFECIVVDDASTDNTSEVVNAYAKKDERFRYYRVDNRSASKTRNAGIDLARGEWISFLDSDDLYAPDKLEWQLDEALGDPQVVMVYGDAFHFRNGDLTNGNVYLADLPNKPSGNAFEALLSCSSIYSPLIRSETIKSLGGFDVSLPFAEDWDMWLSISREGRTVYKPRVAIYYRVHEGNRSAYALYEYRWARRVVKKHVHGMPLSKRVSLIRRSRQYFQRGYAPRIFDTACQATFENRWSEARENWRALLWLAPSRVIKVPVVANVLWSLLPDYPPLWCKQSN